MKEKFCRPFSSILLAILFPAWVGVIFYYHYPGLWRALRDPLAAVNSVPPQYMGLGVVGAGLLVLAIFAGQFGVAYLLSLRSNPRAKGHQRLVVAVLAAAIVLGLAWPLYRYPKLLDAVVNLLLLLIIILMSSFAGRRILSVLGAEPSSLLEAFVFSVGLGLGLLTYVVLALALLGLLYSWMAWLVLVILGVTFVLSMGEELLTRLPPPFDKLRTLHLDCSSGMSSDRRRSSTEVGRARSGDFRSSANRAAEVFLLSLISVCLIVSLIGALAPETEVDALVYHLYIPKVYIQNHRLVYVPYEFRAAFPLGVEMLFTLGMLLRDSILAKLIHFALGVLSLLATYSFGRRYMDSRTGLLAATVFYTVSVVGWSSTTAYIDLGTTFFTTLEMFALVNWWRSQGDRWLAVAAIMCGLAMGTKYFGVFSLVVLIIGVLLKSSLSRFRSAGKRDLLTVSRTIFICAFVSILMISPWLIRNYVFTKNPVYPFFNNIFRSPLMPPVNPTFDRDQFGMGDNVLTKYILSPWNVTFHGDKYRGVIGPIFLAFLPFLAVVKIDKVLGHLLLLCGVFYILWLASFPIIRYLMPILPFLSVIVSYVVHNTVNWDRWESTIFSIEVVGATAAMLFLNLPFFHPFWQEGWSPGIIRHVPYQVVLGTESREHYLSRHISSYEVFRYANRHLSPDAKILCFNEEFRYFSDITLVPIFSFEAGSVASSRNDDELLRHIKELGITHFLVNWASVEEAQRGLTILQDDFVGKHLDPLYRNGSVVLYKLSFKVLPPENYVWQEGESFLSQTGSEAKDVKAPASNDQCLGMGWGGGKGDCVEYEVAVPRDLSSAVLFLRYAREGQTDAALDVYLDDQLVGGSPSLSLPPTGGWGYEADEWAYRELPLGAVEEGKHRLKFVSRVDGGGINIDGFFIADSSFKPPNNMY